MIFVPYLLFLLPCADRCFAFYVEMSIYDFMTLPSWGDAKVVEESHHLSSSLLDRVPSHTTAPAAEGAMISLPTPDEIVMCFKSCIIVRTRVFHRRSDIKDHSFSSNFKIELFLFNSNNCISSVKKWSSQDERNFAIFFHYENNEIDKKGLRVSRDSLSYSEYGIRLMLAPRSAKALQEKILLKLHRIRKLSGSPSFG
nr:hypothetical protein [Tanacetum cinerariifolium]